MAMIMHVLLLVRFFAIVITAQDFQPPFTNLTDSKLDEFHGHGSFSLTQPDLICPSSSYTLGVFPVVNLIGATLSVIAGHQKVVHALTGDF
jgi:hypothetical protein